MLKVKVKGNLCICAELTETPKQSLPAEASALALPVIPQSEGPCCAAD